MQQLAKQISNSKCVKVDCLVIGGGIIGFSCAYQLLKRRPNLSLLLVDKNQYWGEEQTSRNSEVIHAGIYYPNDSLKTQLCIRGRDLLYQFCNTYRIDHQQCGKWIVATNADECDKLHSLYEKCKDLDVPLRFLPRSELLDKCSRSLRINQHTQVLESSKSGILDSHQFLSALEGLVLQHSNVHLSLRTRVESIQFDGALSKYRVEVECTPPRSKSGRITDQSSYRVQLESKAVINAAGLWSDQVAQLLGAHLPETGSYQKQRLPFYKIYPNKGHYYTLPNKDSNGNLRVDRLIYPIPLSNLTGLGIHCTVDLTGRLRLGPDAEWMPFGNEAERLERLSDYSIAEDGPEELHRRQKFFNAIQRYLKVDDTDFDRMAVDYASIRAKLSSQENPQIRDFIVKHETDSGFPGFVNLIGIESPGLTASLAIGEMVSQMDII
ncbi:hypothetical protein MP228_008957 [Amoeboaphelidium protococcarum]|nr:hypothetical protein MP228_008957 [Amoeboaphelidium protococcarum]